MLMGCSIHHPGYMLVFRAMRDGDFYIGIFPCMEYKIWYMYKHISKLALKRPLSYTVIWKTFTFICTVCHATYCNTLRWIGYLL